MRQSHCSSFVALLFAIFSPCFASNLVQCGSGYVLGNVSLSLYGLETEQLDVQAITMNNAKLPQWSLSPADQRLRGLIKASYRRFIVKNVSQFSQLQGSFRYTIYKGEQKIYTSAWAKVHTGKHPALSLTSNLSAPIKGKNGNYRICFAVSGAPHPNITLYRNGSPLSTNTTQFQFQFVNSCLEVYSKSSGVYSLKAENCFGSVEKKVHLLEKPNVDITFKGSGVSVRTSDSNSKGSLIDINMDGADLFVSYKVSGWPKPSVKWFHQNSLIQPSQFNNSLFILQNVSEPDLGTYQIVVGNDLGTTEASFSLQRALEETGSSMDSGNDGLPWWLLGVVAGAFLLLVVFIIIVVCMCRSRCCGKGSRSLEDGIGLKPNSNGVTLHFIHNPTDGEGIVRVLSDNEHFYHEVSPGREASYEPIQIPAVKKYQVVKNTDGDYERPFDDISDEVMVKEKLRMLTLESDGGYEEINTGKNSYKRQDSEQESEHLYHEVCAEGEAAYEQTGKKKKDDMKDNKTWQPATYAIVIDTSKMAGSKYLAVDKKTESLA